MKIWELDRTEDKKYKIVINPEEKRYKIDQEDENAIFIFDSSGDLFDDEGVEISDLFSMGLILNLEFEEVKEIQNGRPKNGENYFYITDNAVCVTEETNCEIDDKRFNNGNYFTDFKKASKEYQIIKLYQKLKKFSVDNGWKDSMLLDKNAYKHCIYLDYDKQCFKTTYQLHCPIFTQMFFATKEVAEKAIELFGDEIKKVYGIED